MTSNSLRNNLKTHKLTSFQVYWVARIAHNITSHHNQAFTSNRNNNINSRLAPHLQQNHDKEEILQSVQNDHRFVKRGEAGGRGTSTYPCPCTRCLSIDGSVFSAHFHFLSLNYVAVSNDWHQSVIHAAWFCPPSDEFLRNGSSGSRKHQHHCSN